MAEVEIRDWKESEVLENLAEDDVVKMCNQGDMIDGRFTGLYTGNEDDKYVFLSRGFTIEPSSEEIMRWRLSGKGFAYTRGRINCFMFDTSESEEEFPTWIEKNSPVYQEYNTRLSSKGL